MNQTKLTLINIVYSIIYTLLSIVITICHNQSSISSLEEKPFVEEIPWNLVIKESILKGTLGERKPKSDNLYLLDT